MKPIILTVGLNHTTAPIDVRERVASSRCLRDEARNTLFSQLDPSLFLETLVLSTCNRTEIYTLTNDPARGEPALREAFAANHAFADGRTDYLYVHTDRAAVEHLFSVACGIDSMLIGEFEILGQVRDAYLRAVEQKSIGPELHQLFQRAVFAGKRARSETAIGSGATSVAYAAVALARRQLGDLKGRLALIVGAGEMGRRAARNLVEDGACTVVVTSRTLEHAEEVAQAVGAGTVPFSELASVLARADVVISATKAPHLILDAGQVAAAMQTRAERPLCLVDIAVPRDIDPGAGRLPNVSLHNVDDLEELVSSNRAVRSQAVEAVRSIIAAEVDSFWEWHMSRRAAPVLSGLDARAEAIRNAELERTFQRLSHLNLSDRDRQVIAAMSSGIVKKLLASPRSNLKAHMQNGDGQLYLDMMSELFELESGSLGG